MTVRYSPISKIPSAIAFSATRYFRQDVRKSVLRVFVPTLTGRIGFDLASEYMRQLGRTTAEELVIEAARLHFNSAASPHHEEMDMAKKWFKPSFPLPLPQELMLCTFSLSMIPLTAVLAAERDLIEGVKLLDRYIPVRSRWRHLLYSNVLLITPSSLGLHLLPVQIRLRLGAVDQLVAQLLEARVEYSFQ